MSGTQHGWRRHVPLLICILGIYFFYIWYAIIQERVYVRRRSVGCLMFVTSPLCSTKARFGPDKEVFPSITALVLIQCLQSAFAGWLGTRRL
jgi:hypothetical protein